MTQTADLIHKMAEFFKSEEFFEKGEDARLELSPDDVRCMNEIIKACGNGVSRQAVLDMLEDINAETEGVGFYYEHYVDYIKALPSVKPQESCDVPDTNDGDIISRQAVLDTISELNAISFYEAQEDSRETYYEIRQAIKDLSPVKPQEPTGHWIYIGNGHNGLNKCSECGEKRKMFDGLEKYCVSCGARMV